ncbi:hypothetical protein ACEQ8H_002493 [Pleosporales sp. CAS-2024a]
MKKYVVPQRPDEFEAALQAYNEAVLRTRHQATTTISAHTTGPMSLPPVPRSSWPPSARTLYPPPGLSLSLDTRQSYSRFWAGFDKKPGNQGSTPIDTTRVTDPGPARLYTVLTIGAAQSGGVHYLLVDNDNGGLFHGWYPGPKAYFQFGDRTWDSFPVHDFMLGNRQMLALSADYLFPTWDYKTRHVSGLCWCDESADTWTKWQDVLAVARSNRKWDSYELRDRLLREMDICTLIRKRPHANLHKYKGAVTMQMGDVWRVKSLGFERMQSTLWDFVHRMKMLRREHVWIIISAVRKAMRHLHAIDIVHGQVRACNVWLNYTMQAKSVRAEQRHQGKEAAAYKPEPGPVAIITHVVLSNFDHATHYEHAGRDAKFHKDVDYDEFQARLLGDWLHAVVPHPEMQTHWLHAILPHPGKHVSASARHALTWLQSGTAPDSTLRMLEKEIDQEMS